jgi:hypothetical protein
MTNKHSEFLSNIPRELAAPRFWLQYENVKDAKHPDKKPRKRPICSYASAEAKAANCRSLDEILTRREPKAGIQRIVMKDEGFVFVDLDHVRNADTGEVERWAEELIEQLDSYTEISASGTGFHIVCRGTLSEDFHLDKNPVEIYSGNIPNKLLALTGNTYGLTLTVESRQEQLTELLRRVKSKDAVPAEPTDWRKRFHTVDELPDGDICFLIEDVLPEGVTFVGALSGAGKTWFCLSLARALTTGKKFLGNHSVPEPVEVLYLCPEMSAKTFKKRCRLFGISERFHCMTISDGVPLNLGEPVLADAIRELKPVVFLDTAVRFSHAEDENAAAQNAQGLARDVFALLHLGARAVCCLHHRPKAGAVEEMTLENTLRGTGDLGAICDAVWGLCYEKGNSEQYAKESRQLVRLTARCVKARDFPAPEDSRIQLSPFIDDIGDFGVLDGDAETTAAEQRLSETEKFNAAISANPGSSLRELQLATNVNKNRIPKLVAESWKQRDGRWLPAGDESSVVSLGLPQ